MHRTGPDPDSLNTHSLETERLLIEVPTPADASALFAMVGGPHRREICATLIWDGPDRIEEIESWIALNSTGTFGERGYHWVIRDKSGDLTGHPGRAMGSLGTRPRGEPGRADVGYWLGREFWGQGVMGEALSKLITFGFEELGYYKMEADVYTSNARGTRLVESAGLTREGVIRKAHRKYGEFVDKALYGIIDEEWRANRG